MYLDGQQYLIGTVLDISRQATTVKGRGCIRVLSQRRVVCVPVLAQCCALM